MSLLFARFSEGEGQACLWHSNHVIWEKRDASSSSSSVAPLAREFHDETDEGTRKAFPSRAHGSTGPQNVDGAAE